MKNVNIAVVGATGAVGQEMLKVLEERNIPIGDLVCLADPKEAGTQVQFKGESITVQAATDASFKGVQIALFAVATEVSKKLAPAAVKAGAVVIDNSYAFRLDDACPLVVPEVNSEDVKWHKGIIANPNCSTIIMVVAINPIHQAAGLQRVVVSTYQAVSGAGIAGLNELTNQSRMVLAGEDYPPQTFDHPIAFNLIPHIDQFEANSYTREEMKMVWETRKIMHLPELRVNPTTVRVPVFRSHSEAINLETEKKITSEEVKKIMATAPGIVLQDDPEHKLYPMPLYTSGHDEVYVGRIREDLSLEHGINLWVVADQIRKGAATNAVQIAEIVVQKNLY